MYKIYPEMTDIEVKRYKILNRIEALEKINDQYIAANGKISDDVYNKIQELYDEYDALKVANCKS